jgi:dsRNA-specific ribonuclease
MVVSCFLYHHMPKATPGTFTVWRQRFSRRATQAVLAYHYGFHKAMCYESPSLFNVCSYRGL